MAQASGPALSAQRLLVFARNLQQARSFTELLHIAHEEVREALGYQHVWFMVSDHEDSEELRMLEVSGQIRDVVWEHAPILKVRGDRFLEELLQSVQPVVIHDARVDPRTDKDMVAKLGNRTLVNVPLRLVDKPFGLFGFGTFGDEGCRPPTPEQVEYVSGMANQLTVAVGRIRFGEAQEQAERSRQSLERRLHQVQKLESLGMLAGGIAHDFNNLLTVIIAAASLAECESTQPEVQSELHSVLAAATRAKDLTTQLLAMSRAQNLDVRPLELGSQLRKLVELCSRILPETIELELVESDTPLVIEGDASQLDQVFLNLLVNARDAMPEGGRVTIEMEVVDIDTGFVEAHPWALPGRYVLTVLSDTGTGMPAEVQECIFEPFFTTKEPGIGTGLGLAVSYGIVQQHGGMIHCYSEVGVGTSFKLYLPVADKSARRESIRPQAPHSAEREERVLVAEDDPLLRAVTTRTLERAGYRVMGVSDGDAASEAIDQEAFDVLLMDVVMPGMTCGDLVDQVKRERPDLPILLTSGYAAGTNVTDLVRRTGLALLRKPYDPNDLLTAVRSAIDTRKRNCVN